MVTMRAPGKVLKKKPCKQCKRLFQPVRPLQPCCSPRCAIDYVNANKKKEFKRETKRLKKTLKTRKDWLIEAQVEFNKYIRLRDERDPCISCQRHHKGKYNAGHYRSRGAAGNIRFNEDNCHKQCEPCNNNLSGNIGEYRINLIKKIGLERVEALENDNTIRRYTIEEAKEIKEYYKQAVKALEKINE